MPSRTYENVPFEARFKHRARRAWQTDSVVYGRRRGDCVWQPGAAAAGVALARVISDEDRLPPALFSLVVPVHNEEANLRPLFAEIVELFAGLAMRAEAIFVNDGSTDGSSAVLAELMGSDARVRVVDHERNLGLTAALATGFRFAAGDVIGMADADMQNPPLELAALLAALPGHDMVVGWRRDRHDSWYRKMQSRIANSYRNRMTREVVHDVGCGLKVFRAEVVQRIKLFKGMHRFLPTLARMEGFRICEVPVRHRARASGQSHFGMWNRLFKGLRDVKAVRWMWANRLPAAGRERTRTAAP